MPKPYQHNMDHSEVFRHLTSSLLTPVEARPTAKQLSTTMEKLGQYFPWDQKNNTEFVKKMTENNNPIAEETGPIEFLKEEKNPVEYPIPKLSAGRQPHKELLDSGLAAGPSTPSNFFSTLRIQEEETNAALLIKKQQKQIEKSIPKLSAVRQSHKLLLDNVLGGTSTSSSFFNSNHMQKTQEEESEKAESRKKIKLTYMGLPINK